MTQYKLTYYNNRGHAEPIRLMLVYLDIPYEDVRIPIGGLTPEKKKELGLEWDELPILEIGGHQMAQSWAIARFLARKYNLAGKTEEEQFRSDEIVEAVRDYFQKILPVFGALHGTDTEKIEALKKTFVEVDSPTHLKRFNDILERNGKIWLVGEELTYADIYLVNMVHYFNSILGAELAKNFSAIVKLSDAVLNHSRVKKYLETRPKTKF